MNDAGRDSGESGWSGCVVRSAAPGIILRWSARWHVPLSRAHIDNVRTITFDAWSRREIGAETQPTTETFGAACDPALVAKTNLPPGSYVVRWNGPARASCVLGSCPPSPFARFPEHLQ